MNCPVKNPEELGRVVRAVRRTQGLRQDDLAAMTGSSHVTLMNIERGKEGVALGRVMQVLRELGIQVQLDVPPEAVQAVRKALGEDAG